MGNLFVKDDERCYNFPIELRKLIMQYLYSNTSVDNLINMLSIDLRLKDTIEWCYKHSTTNYGKRIVALKPTLGSFIVYRDGVFNFNKITIDELLFNYDSDPSIYESFKITRFITICWHDFYRYKREQYQCYILITERAIQYNHFNLLSRVVDDLISFTHLDLNLIKDVYSLIPISEMYYNITVKVLNFIIDKERQIRNEELMQEIEIKKNAEESDRPACFNPSDHDWSGSSTD